MIFMLSAEGDDKHTSTRRRWAKKREAHRREKPKTEKLFAKNVNENVLWLLLDRNKKKKVKHGFLMGNLLLERLMNRRVVSMKIRLSADAFVE